MHRIIILAISFITILTGWVIGQDKMKSPLKVVPSVDFKRYAGTWYEIARLPNKFQNDCTGNVTATYSLQENGELEVINRCKKDDGTIEEAEGRAKRLSENEPSSKLKVRFAPSFLAFLPFVWGDYWILDLAEDYSYVVIGEPDRRYLWVLARTPHMEVGTLSTLLKRVVDEQGYDLTGLIRTAQ